MIAHTPPPNPLYPRKARLRGSRSSPLYNPKVQLSKNGSEMFQKPLGNLNLGRSVARKSPYKAPIDTVPRAQTQSLEHKVRCVSLVSLVSVARSY